MWETRLKSGHAAIEAKTKAPLVTVKTMKLPSSTAASTPGTPGTNAPPRHTTDDPSVHDVVLPKVLGTETAPSVPDGRVAFSCTPPPLPILRAQDTSTVPR